MKSKVLEVSNLVMQFVGLKAVNNVSIDLYKSEITALIGPNGAGKITFFNCVTEVYTPTSEDIIVNTDLKTVRVNGKKPNKITELGLARTFQNIRLFESMTVLENLELGAFLRKDKKGIKRDIEYMYSLFPTLGKRHHQRGGTLSGGEQQMLSIPRELMMGLEKNI